MCGFASVVAGQLAFVVNKGRWPIYATILAWAISDGVCASDIHVRRPFTVDDMLKLESVDKVQFTPSGRSILLEYQSPYDERGNYGVERGGAILRLDLSEGSKPVPLFLHEPGKKYWSGDFSPDGRRLLVFQADRHSTQLGVFDFESNRFTPIEENPQVNERFEKNAPVWINNNEIVFSSASNGWTHYGTRGRPYVADKISRLTERAFAGHSSVDDISTDPIKHWYEGRLVRYNLRTKRRTVLGRGRFGSFRLNNNGRKLAALRLGQRLMHASVDQLTDYYRFDTQLYVFDLLNNSSEPLLPDSHVLMDSLRWSSAEPKLSFFAWNRTALMEEGSYYVKGRDSISAVQPEGFEPTWLHRGGYTTLRTPVAAEWLGGKLILHGAFSGASGQRDEPTASADLNASDHAKWYSIDLDRMEAGNVLNSGMHSPELYRMSGGQALLKADAAYYLISDSTNPIELNITGDSTEILRSDWHRSSEKTIAFIAYIQDRQKLGFLDLNSNRLTAPILDISDKIAASNSDGQQVITRRGGKHGGQLDLHTADGRRTIFTFNVHLSEVQPPNWKKIKHPGASGADTFSCVLLPYNYEPNRSYPTIVDVYPGRNSGCREDRGIVLFHNSNDLVAASGYLVVFPSNTSVRNQLDGTLYGGLKTQIDSALDALIAAGMTDAQRIGIWGFSNGSMASLWLASVSDRFKAVIPMFGASSPHIEYFSGASPPRFQLYLGTPIIHLLQYESAPGTMPLSMGRSAIEDPLGFVTSSPLDRAKHICSPVMMVHSDLDTFTLFHYEALFAALYRLGKPAELVRYYGEGHGLRSPQNIRDFYKRVLAFFDRHVKAGAPVGGCGAPIPRL